MEFKTYKENVVTYKGDLVKIAKELKIRDLYSHWWNYWWGKIMFSSWGPLNKIKQLICSHDYAPVSILYDDYHCVYRCTKCGKYKVKEYR